MGAFFGDDSGLKSLSCERENSCCPFCFLEEGGLKLESDIVRHEMQRYQYQRSLEEFI